MNYFINEETLTQKEDSGKKTGKDRRNASKKWEMFFVKRGVMVKAEIPRR